MSFQDLEAGTPAPLPQVVAHGVFQIHTKAAALRRLGDALGTPRESSALHARLRATQAEATRLAKTTAQNLKQGTDNNSIAPGSKLAMDFEAAMRELQQAQQRVKAAERRVQLQLQQQQTRKEEEEELLVFSADGVRELAVAEEERDQGIREVDRVIAELDGILGDLALAALADDDGHQWGGSVVVNDHVAVCGIERAAEATSREGEGEEVLLATSRSSSSSSTRCLLLAVVGLVLFIFLMVLV